MYGDVHGGCIKFSLTGLDRGIWRYVVGELTLCCLELVCFCYDLICNEYVCMRIPSLAWNN